MSKAAAFFIFLLFVIPVYAAGVININSADQVALETLQGIGPTKAKAIIEYRTVHGPFARIEDIEKVTGIGPKIFGDIKAFITVESPQLAPAPTPAAIEKPAPKLVPRAAPIVIPKTVPKTVVEQPVPIQTAATTTHVAAAAASETSSHTALWLSLTALVGLLGGSVAGVRYLRPRHSPEETMLTAEEFEIEE
jgi:competence protein ComEA